MIPSRILLWPLVLVIAAAALWMTMHVRADMSLHTVALFIHVMSLVVGFGAVLAVDFQAAMWMLGRRRLIDVTRFGAATHALIWIGLGGLVLSGILLHPDLSSTLTRIKLGLVLIIALNGIVAMGVQSKLDQTREQKPPVGLLIRATVAVMISQGAWWGAAAIGFTNTQSTSTTAAGQSSGSGSAGTKVRAGNAPAPYSPVLERPVALPPKRAANMTAAGASPPTKPAGSSVGARQAGRCPPTMR